MDKKKSQYLFCRKTWGTPLNGMFWMVQESEGVLNLIVCLYFSIFSKEKLKNSFITIFAKYCKNIYLLLMYRVSSVDLDLNDQGEVKTE